MNANMLFKLLPKSGICSHQMIFYSWTHSQTHLWAAWYHSPWAAEHLLWATTGQRDLKDRHSKISEVFHGLTAFLWTADSALTLKRLIFWALFMLEVAGLQYQIFFTCFSFLFSIFLTLFLHLPNYHMRFSITLFSLHLWPPVPP